MTTYYTPSGNPTFDSPGSTASVRAEFVSIATAFDNLSSSTVGTSTTSLLIPTSVPATRVFSTTKQFVAGQFFSATSAANSANYMHGVVVSYVNPTLTTTVTDTGGSGTLADWNLSISGSQGVPGAGITPQAVGFTASGGTSSKTLTVALDANVAGTNTGDQTPTSLGLVIGTNVQAYNANLTAINQALTATSSPSFTTVTAALTGNASTASTASAVAVGGVTGLGTNVGTALAVAVGTAGAVQLNNGSGAGLSSVNAATLGGATFAAPGSIGGVTVDSTTNKPVTAASLNGGTLPGSFTTLSATGAITTNGNTVAILGTNTFTAAQIGTVTALSVGSNLVAVNLALANDFSLTLQATTAQTLSNPTNAVAGQAGQIVITQNGTPSALAFGSQWFSEDGTTKTVSTTAGAVNLLSYYVESSTRIAFSLTKHGVA